MSDFGKEVFLGDMRAASGSAVTGAANYARRAPCSPHCGCVLAQRRVSPGAAVPATKVADETRAWRAARRRASRRAPALDATGPGLARLPAPHRLAALIP